MSTEINPEVVIKTAAADVHKRYRSFVEWEDLVQEGWLWVLEHPMRVRKYQDDPETGIAYKQLYSEVASHVERYARENKRQSLGYEPDDEAFYTRKTLLAILPYVLAGEYERQGERHEVRSKNDPAEGGDFFASILDVARAWEGTDLTPDEYDLLVAYSQDGVSLRDIGEKLDVSPQTAANRINRALDKMVTFLGGREPRCGEGCAGCRCCTYGSRRPDMHSADSGMNQIGS